MRRQAKAVFLASGIALGALLAGVVNSAAQAAEIIQPKNVVELFTSQGCYSCPPADKILGELSKTDDTLALAWHVTYWDYLGWKDSFATKTGTDRQHLYAKSLGERQVYTPQAIVNGRAHVVGSRGDDLRTLISTFDGTDKGMVVPINASISADVLEVTIPANAHSQNATLWLVYFDKKRQVKIDRGENAGKTLAYHNIVREVEMMGMVKDGELRMNLPIAELKRKGYSDCALVLQTTGKDKGPGPIIGAAIIRELGE